MIVKLVDIFNLQMGKTPARNNKAYWNDGEYDWISISDLGNYKKYISSTKEKITELAIKESGIKKVPSHTLLMSFKLSVGKTAITKCEVYTNEAIMAFIPKHKYDVYIDYFYYLFSWKDWSNDTSRAVMGATLNKSTLGQIMVKIPPLDEQCKIAETLDKVCNLIAKRKEQLEKLDLLVKSKFVEMFGNPENNSNNFQIEKLSKYLNVIGGYAFKSVNFLDVGIPILRIGNINSGHFKPVNMVFWKEDFTLEKYKVYPNDLVMSLTGTVGKDDYGNVCILGNEYDEYYLNQRNAKLQMTGNLNKWYLMQILKFPSVKSKLTGISRGVRQANISNRDILNLCIPIPPIELQNQFAEFVQQTEQTKTIINQSLEKLETLKKALMQEYFG